MLQVVIQYYKNQNYCQLSAIPIYPQSIYGYYKKINLCTIIMCNRLKISYKNKITAQYSGTK